MDVVKRNIGDIRGEIEVFTKVGQGSTFQIKLPLTLSIIDGLRIEIGTTELYSSTVLLFKNVMKW
jgi:two-component system chemotaxis sensor kinase CheA